MTVYLWILSGLVLLIFLVWFFFGRTDLARTANLLVDLVIIVTVCVQCSALSAICNFKIKTQKRQRQLIR